MEQKIPNCLMIALQSSPWSNGKKVLKGKKVSFLGVKSRYVTEIDKSIKSNDKSRDK